MLVYLCEQFSDNYFLTKTLRCLNKSEILERRRAIRYPRAN